MSNSMSVSAKYIQLVKELLDKKKKKKELEK